MSEPDITALARRLAEQNNVDWRGLRGSGDDGKIVERDVLDYLARVMAGDEALDPTPEPLPEGMESWPDQDVNGFRPGGETTTLGELRHEIGNAVRDEPPATVGATDEPNAGADQEVNEDVFLFDDEPGAAQEAPEGGGLAPQDEQVMAPLGDDLEDLLVAGDEPLSLGEDEVQVADVDVFGEADAGIGDAGDHQFGAGESRADDILPEVRFEEAPAEEHEGVWGEGISLGQPDHAEEGETPDIWGEPARAADADVDLFAEAVGPAAEETDAFDVGFGSESEETGTSGPSQAAGDAESPWDTGTDEAQESPWSASGTDEAQESPWSASGADGAEQERAEEEQASYDWGEPAAVTSEPSAAPENDVVSRDSDLFTDETDLGGVDPAVAATGEAPTELSSVGPTEPVFEGLPLARTGTVLRRHVDVSALAAAQLSVSQELGFDEPLGAAPFVLRAVAKAAAGMDEGLGQVALATLDGGLLLRRVDDAAGKPFAALVNELSSDGSEEDEAGLVAADLSGLDIDEVVLDVGLPVVSLGRMLYDNQRGGYRSTLTLAGDMPADQGARLLSRVAQLLDSPVRLVM